MKKVLFIFILCFLVTRVCFADEKIVYSAPDNGFWQIWVYNLTTGEDVKLTESSQDKKNPVWSPDGKNILYRSGNGELFIIDVQSNFKKEILAKVKYCADPKWVSEDKLLLTRYRTDILDDSDIWLYSFKEEKPQVLVSDKSLQFQADLSADEKTLVYVSALNPDHHALYRKDLSSGETTKITAFSEESFCFEPQISPDGSRVVFVSNQSGDNELYIIELANLKVEQLTNHQGIDTEPTWINDQEIAYCSYRKSKFQINRLNVTTKAEEIILNKDEDCTSPDYYRD